MEGEAARQWEEGVGGDDEEGGGGLGVGESEVEPGLDAEALVRACGLFDGGEEGLDFLRGGGF